MGAINFTAMLHELVTGDMYSILDHISCCTLIFYCLLFQVSYYHIINH